MASLLKMELPEGFGPLKGKKGALFAIAEIEYFLKQEAEYDRKILSTTTRQSLKTMSSGERKKALLAYVKRQQPDFLILVNAFDHLDVETRALLQKELEHASKRVHFVQLCARLDDFLRLDNTLFGQLNESELKWYHDHSALESAALKENGILEAKIPSALQSNSPLSAKLVVLKNINIEFWGKKVVNSLNWTIKKGEFWLLSGPNGSGKTSLLNLIIGDSPKGYGQDVILFGLKKGGGESVWDVKQHIGYVTPALTDRFRGYHTAEKMLLSGLYDSIGLYDQPTENEEQLARQWLRLLHLEDKRDVYFNRLTQGQKRLLLVARAMIKHPPLLILDEPTAGLDEVSTKLLVTLINKIAAESTTAIVFVSHRKEKGLRPEFELKLVPSDQGSIGKLHTLE